MLSGTAVLLKEFEIIVGMLIGGLFIVLLKSRLDSLDGDTSSLDVALRLRSPIGIQIRQIMKKLPNVEEIYIYSEQDLTELPMIMQSLNGFKFKKLKSLQVDVDNFVEEEELEELEILSVEDKKLLAQETIKIMKRVLPIKVKASVVEILDHDHLDDFDNGIDSPRNMLVLIKKEANEDPKLIMLQRFLGSGLELESEEEPAQVEPIQHRSQVESASLTVQAVQAVVFAVIAVITVIALTIYSISSMY